MAEQVQLNIEVFRKNVESIRTSVTNIKSSVQKGRSLSKTNITPFTTDLKNFIEAVELLEQYKLLFQEDLKVIKNVGEKIRERDEQIANNNSAATLTE